MTISMKKDGDLMKSVAVLTVLVMVCSAFAVLFLNTSAAADTDGTDTDADTGFDFVEVNRPEVELGQFLDTDEIPAIFSKLMDVGIDDSDRNTDSFSERSGEKLVIDGDVSFESLYVDDEAEIQFKNGTLSIEDNGVLYIEKSAKFLNSGSPVDIVLGSGAYLIIGVAVIQADDKMEIDSESDFSVSGDLTAEKTGVGNEFYISVDILGTDEKSSLSFKNITGDTKDKTASLEITMIDLYNGNDTGTDFYVSFSADFTDAGSMTLGELFSSQFGSVADGEKSFNIEAIISISDLRYDYTPNHSVSWVCNQLDIKGLGCAFKATDKDTVKIDIDADCLSYYEYTPSDTAEVYGLSADPEQSKPGELLSITVKDLCIDMTLGADACLNVAIGEETDGLKVDYADKAMDVTTRTISNLAVSVSGETGFVLSLLDAIGEDGEDESSDVSFGEIILGEKSPYSISFGFGCSYEDTYTFLRNGDDPIYDCQKNGYELEKFLIKIAAGDGAVETTLSADGLTVREDRTQQCPYGDMYAQTKTSELIGITGLNVSVNGGVTDIVTVLGHYMGILEKDDIGSSDITEWFNHPETENTVKFSSDIEEINLISSSDSSAEDIKDAKLPAGFENPSEERNAKSTVILEKLKVVIEGDDATLNLGSITVRDRDGKSSETESYDNILNIGAEDLKIQTYTNSEGKSVLAVDVEIITGTDGTSESTDSKEPHTYTGFAISGLHAELITNETGLQDFVAAVILYSILGPDNVDDGIKDAISEELLAEVSVSVELSLGSFVCGEYRFTESGMETIREITVGYPEVPARKYGLSVGFNFTGQLWDDSTVNLGSGAYIHILDGSSLRITDNELGTEYVMKDVQFELSFLADFKMKLTLDGKEFLKDFVSNLSTASAGVDITIGEMSGSDTNDGVTYAVSLTDIEYHGSIDFASIFGNRESSSAESSSDAVFTGVTVGKVIVSEKVIGENTSEVTITLFNGKLGISDPGDNTIIDIDCESRLVGAKGNEISNLIEDGRYLGSVFIIGSGGIRWGEVGDDGTINEPEARERGTGFTFPFP